MDPFSIAAASMAATAGAGVIKAAGDIMGGSAQSSMYQYQAGIAQMNAQIAKQNAVYARQKGELDAFRSGLKTAQQIGQITAGQAASGIDVNRGSAVAVRGSQQRIGDFDQSIIRANASKEAYGYRVQGIMDTAQSTIDQFAARESTTAGYIGAAGSLLGAAGSVGSQWMTAKRVGIEPQTETSSIWS